MSDQSEAPRRRRRQPQEATPPSQGSAAKGVILVVVAVLIGFALLQDQDSSTAQVAVGADDDPSAAPTDDGGEDDEGTATTSSTTEAADPPSEVKVLVANGSEVNGAAGAMSDTLESLGYVTANPANAELVPSTVVYFTPGYEAEAEALAEEIGADPSSVTALPTPAPVADMQLSNILVVVGPDLATGG